MAPVGELGEERPKPFHLPLAVEPVWRGHHTETGTWKSEWPEHLCKECGSPFEGVSARRYCSDQCKKKAKNRSGNHAGRTRKRGRRDARRPVKYDIIGKFELHDAFRGLCGYCAKPVALDELLVGHVVGVREGGQHTRRNVAPIHADCEETWNRICAAEPPG